MCALLVIVALLRHGWQQPTQAGIFYLLSNAPVATLLLLLSSALEPRQITITTGLACAAYLILLVLTLRWLLRKVRHQSIGTARLLDMLLLLWLPVALTPASSKVHLPGAMLVLILIIILRLPLTWSRLQKAATAADRRQGAMPAGNDDQS